ncbi:long-chain-fatty-acid--CoA ligase [Methylobacterium nodulans]|uniref:Long-chain-fatty-acid--CoA ligase n=1 Tax=Methylobacterium nodulans (strain LMG 21967 / CNCM I-2342 / ORS 2060) TaxID=460265 RepID=B8IRW1_METNO|nr:long-chain-fatty-acid--CoA ligase [Methylobacterium nodulans]ACL60661.1 AMP-dependent synthetase and ligase [Methylobacterium nodulans ORS 2060]
MGDPVRVTSAHYPERPWLKAYPSDVPAEIDVDGLGTLADLFATATARYADRPAIRCFGATLSFAQLKAGAEAFAGWLQAQGIRKGDRVALMLPNVPTYPIALFGTLIAGATAVNVNPLYTARELTHQVGDAGARMLVVLENFAGVVAQALPALPELEMVVVAGAGDGLRLRGVLITLAARYLKKAVPPYSLPPGRGTRFLAVLAAGRKAGFRPLPIAPGDLAFLQYTGGTTGVSKGAMLTHRNVMANIEQTRVWFGMRDDEGPGRVMVTALPLYHIYGLTCCFFFMVRLGACCLFVPNPRDIAGFVKLLRTNRFTDLSGVNTLFNALLNHPDIGKVDWSALEYVNAGGMAVQAVVARRWKALTGKPIIEGYGLSETAPVVSINPRTLTEWSGTIGYPVPSTEISVRDAAGAEVPIGEAGELCVRGPQVMPGYWRRPEETAKAMTPDGFFRTGDIAVLQPDGQLRLVDRMKDMILVSGFNVYPNEVEDVLATHPGVLEVAVVGRPMPETGESVVAHVVRRDPDLTAEALRAFARKNLTSYKVPREIVFHGALPKSNVGKVLRRELRDGGA